MITVNYHLVGSRTFCVDLSTEREWYSNFKSGVEEMEREAEERRFFLTRGVSGSFYAQLYGSSIRAFLNHKKDGVRRFLRVLSII